MLRDNSTDVPERFRRGFDFSWQNIRDTIQKAKELNARCWLAYVVESTLEPGGPPPTKEAGALKKAFQIQRNALTLTRYGRALMFQSAGARDLEGQKRGQQILIRAERLYPTYYKSSYSVYRAYGYPRVANEAKSFAALLRFYNTIPPEHRKASWVVRYLKHLRLEEELRVIGVSL
jgi:hypothetical protein